MKTLYFAAPLFTLTEREFNGVLASRLNAALREVEIILSQERPKKVALQVKKLPYLMSYCKMKKCSQLLE